MYKKLAVSVFRFIGFVNRHYYNLPGDGTLSIKLTFANCVLCKDGHSKCLPFVFCPLAQNDSQFHQRTTCDGSNKN